MKVLISVYFFLGLFSFGCNQATDSQNEEVPIQREQEYDSKDTREKGEPLKTDDELDIDRGIFDNDEL